MADPYSPPKPYDHGMLDVGDDNLIYWETRGNPGGKPALIVHGGPGSSCERSTGRSFNPARYRVVLFDQRGCGRSTPHASDPSSDMSVNTTEHLLADMERLREHLGIERWLLFGGSWGSTLILAYAELHPERVSAIVINGVTAGRRSEIDWLYRGVGRFFPEEWERFRDGFGGRAGRRPPRRLRAAHGVSGRRRARQGHSRLAGVGGRGHLAGTAWDTQRVQLPAAGRAGRARPHLLQLLL